MGIVVEEKGKNIDMELSSKDQMDLKFDTLLLYKYCQKMRQNPCFWENCLIGVIKMHYNQKQKLF